MDTEKAYDLWAKNYDIDLNKTRDIEAEALKNVLEKYHFRNCLEIGCGTGKNTEHLLTKAESITAVDLSAEMMKKAKEKIHSGKVKFIRANILGEWNFLDEMYDLAVFSLVLEHIENLSFIFKEAWKKLSPGGLIYIGELHPFKQYLGSKAKFMREDKEETLVSFNHNISDFIRTGIASGFKIENIDEFFEGDERKNIPRILTILFKKPQK
jgi:ubiquinone/menaquinone biosynthesis C-methylase UbiE